LEKHQGLSTRSRNLRLTALRSVLSFRSFRGTGSFRTDTTGARHPQQAFYPTLVQFLTRAEVDALLAAPDQRTWSGRRDHAFILLAVQTGLRYPR